MRGRNYILHLLLLFLILSNSLAFLMAGVDPNLTVQASWEKKTPRVITNLNQNSSTDDPPKVLTILSGAVHGLGTAEHPEFHPAFEIGDYFHSLCYDPLVEYDLETGELIPALASQWVVTYDCKHWIFTLRDDVFFHDGTKLNATAVKYAYDTLIDPDHMFYAPDSLWINLPLESVKILDEYTVSINFYESYASFIRQEAPWICIPSPYNWTQPILWPAGSGPYILSEYQNQSAFYNYTLTRFEQHFRGMPPFERINYLMYHTVDNFTAAIENKLGDLATMGWDTGENDTYWQLSSAGVGIEVGFLSQEVDELSDWRVRLALNYAINKSLYIENRL